MFSGANYILDVAIRGVPSGSALCITIRSKYVRDIIYDVIYKFCSVSPFQKTKLTISKAYMNVWLKLNDCNESNGDAIKPVFGVSDKMRFKQVSSST